MDLCRILSDYEISARGDHRARCECEVHAVGEIPARKIDRAGAAVVQFDELDQFGPNVGIVVYLVDHDSRELAACEIDRSRRRSCEPAGLRIVDGVAGQKLRRDQQIRIRVQDVQSVYRQDVRSLDQLAEMGRDVDRLEGDSLCVVAGRRRRGVPR